MKNAAIHEVLVEWIIKAVVALIVYTLIMQ